MAASRVTAAAKAVVLVLLAALSVTWTATLVTVGSGAPAAGQGEQTLPDGTAMPTEAIEVPASVSGADAMSAGSASQAIATASTNGIPSVALAAYQRAESVINNADDTCHLPWQLIAALGRVESDHGRVGGNSLDDEGVATPGIYGVALDGKGRTAVIRDTDGGQLDRDHRFDRAIGPMQFIPSTWSVVGVDADSDGTRNPQDIDDAALATAVYLCSGSDDLADEAGQRASVFRYNHSEQYVDLVLAIMNAYLAGDYTPVPNGTMAGGYLVPLGAQPSARPTPQDRNTEGPGPTDGGGDPGPKAPTPGTPTPGTPTPAPTPSPTPAPTPAPTPKSPSPTPTASPTPSLPVPAPTLPVPVPTIPPPTPTVLLTLPQAIAECLSRGFVDDLLASNDAFDQCVFDLTH